MAFCIQIRLYTNTLHLELSLSVLELGIGIISYRVIYSKFQSLQSLCAYKMWFDVKVLIHENTQR